MHEKQGSATPDFPQELIAHRRWCRWSLVPGHGRPTKRPDQSTLELHRCRAFIEVHHGTADHTRGVGFVFTGGVVVGDKRLIGIDIDSCVADGSRLSDGVRELLLALDDPWWEFSPSGTGIHIYAWVSAQLNVASKVALPWVGTTDKRPELQWFGFGPAGYMTVTGALPIRLTPRTKITTLTTLHIDALEKLIGPVRAGNLVEEQGTTTALHEASVGKELVTPAEFGERFIGEGAINGRWREAGYPSASEAFYALVQTALREAAIHGVAPQSVVDFLMTTSWGRGEIDDSRDPDKYARRSWVEKEVLRALKKTHAGESAQQMFEPLPPGPASPPPPSRLFPYSEFLATRAKERFMVDGLLPQTGVVQFFGDPGTGKTPVVMSLAMHIAGKLPTWFGHEVKRHGKVIYFVGEDRNGLGWRAQAEHEALGLDPALLEDRLLFTRQPGRLTDGEDVKQWFEELQVAAGADGIALIVVDTQAQNFGDGDENATKDMNVFTRHLSVLSQGLGALIALVHHTGHGDKTRGRGSSVLYAAADGAYEVTRDPAEQSLVKVTARKSKNWATPDPLLGRLVVRNVGGEEGQTAVTLDTSASVQQFSLEGIQRSLSDDLDLALVWAALQRFGGAEFTLDALVEETSLGKKRIRALLAQLVDVGVVANASDRKSSRYPLTPLGFRIE